MNDDVACCSLQSRMRNNNVKGPSSKNIRIHFARRKRKKRKGRRRVKGDKGSRSSLWSSCFSSSSSDRCTPKDEVPTYGCECVCER